MTVFKKGDEKLMALNEAQRRAFIASGYEEVEEEVTKKEPTKKAATPKE